MSTIRFRLAKPCDAKQIANCHWHVRDRYTKGIFLSLGKRFLITYYKIILNDPYEVIVCAEKDKNKIIGFSSATLNAEKQALNLRKHKIQLAFSAIWAVICKPSLLKEVWNRYRSLEGSKNAPTFIHTEGVRGEYWCWLKEEGDDGLLAIEMGKIKESIIFDLGYEELFFEVDKFNKRVYKFYTKIEKSEVIEEITLPDGRERVLFKKKLHSLNKPSLS